MKCPKCGAELVTKPYRGIMEVDECPNDHGMWLDLDELDKLEDVVFEDDAWKGSLVDNDRLSDYKCPHCGRPLHQFQYRFYDLTLEYCVEGRHGFWLDAGEDERVIELMRQRQKDLKKKFSAEAEWGKAVRRFRSKSLFDDLLGLFHK